MKTLKRCLSHLFDALIKFQGFDIQTLCDIHGKFKCHFFRRKGPIIAKVLGKDKK